MKKFLPLLLLMLLMVVAFAMGLHHHISLAAFHAHKEMLSLFVQDHGVLAALVFMSVYIAAVALSLPVATLLTLAGGFLFGKWMGTLYVVTGATIGASIIFLIAKSALGETLRARAGGFYQKVEKNMTENAFGYLLFLRLVPAFPFFIVNILPALFNVPLRIFSVTTLIGILPGTFVFVNVGETLGTLQSLNDLISAKTLFAFALLGILALVPTIYKQIKERRNV